MGVILAVLLAVASTGPVVRGAATSTPLLEAIASLDPTSELVGVDFVDWAQLKALHGGASITSASPLQERQQLLLDIARSESLTLGLGLDRLATMAASWGWDTTDLEWQARYLDVPGGSGKHVLRFGQHWDLDAFRGALERWGYEHDDGAIELWLPPLEAIPAEIHLERVDGHVRTGPDLWETHAVVAIDPDARTVVIHEFARFAPPKQLRLASRPHAGRVAGHPAVRAAAALDHPLAADVQASSRAELFCALPEEAGYLEGDPETRAIVDELDRYDAQANGYTRPARDAPAQGRHVFAYDKRPKARLDLEARSALAVAGPRARVVSLIDARTQDRELIIDVEPIHGHPDVGLVGPRLAWAPFVMCGSSKRRAGQST